MADGKRLVSYGRLKAIGRLARVVVTPSPVTGSVLLVSVTSVAAGPAMRVHLLYIFSSGILKRCLST